MPPRTSPVPVAGGGPGPAARLLTVALLLAVIGAAPSHAQAPTAAERPLRVVTLNLLHGGALSGWNGQDDELESRLDLAANALEALDPDVVALQEASVSRGRGTVASRLAGRLGMTHVYTSATYTFVSSRWLGARMAAFMNFEEGPAILSRFPILHAAAHRLPNCGRPFALRALVLAVLGTPWGRVPVFSTHTAGDACHTRAVAELVQKNREDAPGILMGDFNAVETSPAIGALTDSAGLLDVFRMANPGEPGPTSRQPVTAAERRARHRIDYIFLVPGRRTVGTVIGSRVVLDSPGALPDGRPLWPSDHYGVLADLALPHLSPPSTPGVAQRPAPTGEAPGPDRAAQADRLTPGALATSDGLHPPP